MSLSAAQNPQVKDLIFLAKDFVKREENEEAADAVRIVESFFAGKSKVSEVCRAYDKLSKSNDIKSFASERLLCALVRAIDGCELQWVQMAAFEATFAAGVTVGETRASKVEK